MAESFPETKCIKITQIGVLEIKLITCGRSSPQDTAQASPTNNIPYCSSFFGHSTRRISIIIYSISRSSASVPIVEMRQLYCSRRLPHRVCPSIIIGAKSASERTNSFILSPDGGVDNQRGRGPTPWIRSWYVSHNPAWLL